MTLINWAIECDTIGVIKSSYLKEKLIKKTPFFGLLFEI